MTSIDTTTGSYAVKPMNTNLWKNAYALLIYDATGFFKGFTFSVAPQSEEFRYPQRISETKTFGGSVIDDYGNDLVQITLSGSTINQELKYVFSDEKQTTPHLMTGEEEIFYLKDCLADAGKFDKLDGKKVYLYSLASNKTQYNPGQGGKFTNDINTGYSKPRWWRVFPQDLQIKRSKDNPLAWNYTLQFIGYDGETEKTWEQNKTNANINYGISYKVTNTNSIVEKLKKTNKVLTFLNNFASYSKTISVCCANLKSCINKVEESVATYENAISGIYDSISQAYKDVVGIGDFIYRKTLRLTIGVVNNLMSDVNDFFDSIKTTTESIGSLDTEALANGYLSEFNIEADYITDVFTKVCNDLTMYGESIVADTKRLFTGQEVLPITIENTQDDEDSDTNNSTETSIVITYGATPYTVKTSDTWDSLSKKFYGDASYGQIIATYNAAKKLDLTVGSSILIPILNENEGNSFNKNKLYLDLGVHDNYGADLRIKDDDLFFANGDVTIIDGKSNLNQAITDRLTSKVSSNIRRFMYGISSAVGNVQESSKIYILSSIQQTLAQEPRILEVNRISYQGSGDTLYIKIEYTDINGAKQVYEGAI